MEESIINIPKALPQHIALEKKKAQQLKKTSWWKNQLARNQCYYCKKQFHPTKLTMDHKVSLIRGGTSGKKNLVPSCLNCNRQKKHLLEGELEIYSLKKL